MAKVSKLFEYIVFGYTVFGYTKNIQFLEPVSMLKSPAMIMSSFDRSGFADWLVS